MSACPAALHNPPFSTRIVAATLSGFALVNTSHIQALGRALDTLPDVDDDYEPIILHQDRAQTAPRYNDVRFSGSIGTYLPPMELDISVITLFGITAFARQLPRDDSPL